MLDGSTLEGLDHSMVDHLKRLFYEQSEVLDRCVAAAVADAASRDLVEDIFRAAPSPDEMRVLRDYADSFVSRHRTQLDRLIRHLASAVDLDATTRNIDQLMTQMQGWPISALREVLIGYLGFSFWDVLTFPILPWREAGEFNEIKVDRISAQDAREVERLGTFPLKGSAFNQFAAFFSRAYRENDYLLGRLHAFDRLIDIVCDAAGPGVAGPAMTARLKKQGFLRILNNEEPHLPTCAAMIAQLRTALAAGNSG
jgi:hypothetical protein